MVGTHGNFPGITGGNSKGYIVVAPKDTSDGAGAGTTFAIGPVTEHFANQATNAQDSLNYGMAGSFTSVPAGYTMETVLVASVAADQPAPDGAKPERASVPAGGVNAALFEYGDFVLSRHSKSRAQGDHTTETEFLGYSGTSYYFYNLCDCLDDPRPSCQGPPCERAGAQPGTELRRSCSTSPIPSRFLADAATPGVCASYSDTLIAVNAALKEQQIPIKHFLLDSWWYGEGWNNGVALWEDVPECTGNSSSLAPGAYPANSFPQGLKAFHKAIGVDKVIWVHNGAWQPGSPYRKDYEFASERGPPQGKLLRRRAHFFSPFSPPPH